MSESLVQHRSKTSAVLTYLLLASSCVGYFLDAGVCQQFMDFVDHFGSSYFRS